MRMSDGRVRLPGAMRLEQAALILRRCARSGPARRSAVFIVAEAGRLPDIGERLTIYGLESSRGRRERAR